MKNKTQLPYLSSLKDFEKNGQIIHRADIYGSGPPSSIVSQETLGYIKKYAGTNILDIGCGIGAYIRELSKERYICKGIEYNKDYVRTCIENGFSVRFMSADKLKYGDSSFDTVLMIEVLEHLKNPEKALFKAFRVAKKNLIISVPNIDVIPLMSKYQVVPWHLLEATHINFFTPKTLRNLLGKFTKKIRILTYGHFAQWITEKRMYMHILAIASK